MRSCGGARGSELTTNIITVWAVEEVGDRAGGGSLRNTSLQLLFLCLFYGASCWEGRLLSRHVSLDAVVGVSVSLYIWDTMKRKDAAVPPLLCTYFPQALPLFHRAHCIWICGSFGFTSAGSHVPFNNSPQCCGRSENMETDILSRPLRSFMKLILAFQFNFWSCWCTVCAASW